MKDKKLKVAVSKRALVQRINRKLAHQDKKLKAGTERTWSTTGDYFIVSLVPSHGNFIVGMNIDIEELGEELGVLQPWEKLEESQ
jgi:hypothetical protein